MFSVSNAALMNNVLSFFFLLSNCWVGVMSLSAEFYTLNNVSGM